MAGPRLGWGPGLLWEEGSRAALMSPAALRAQSVHTPFLHLNLPSLR